ncbi:MAG: DUF1624 domain-containing protein [Acidobacteria bacterium]|nr:DUF1624 domain-containing protein [Acidobacteriota bacterium]
MLAILFMVQGHTLDVLLAPVYREGSLFNFWLFLRGLTAPTFLLLSGFSFTLASVKYWDSYLSPTPKLLKRVLRFASFVLLGYAMHLPVNSFRDLRWLDAAGWQSWMQVDVLQCIGFTLLILQALIFFARTLPRFAVAALSLSGLIALIAPLAGRTDWAQHHVSPWLASYLNAATGSLFPLFPWAAYVLCGAAMGYGWVRWQGRAKTSAGWIFAVGGLALLGAGLALNQTIIELYQRMDYWRTSPSLFLMRVGCVWLLLSLIAWALRGLNAVRLALPEKPIRALAQESLTIYFAHICILYGSVWNIGLRQRLGATLTPGATLACIALLLIAMIVLGILWNRFKTAQPQSSWWLRSAVLAAAFTYCCV